MTVLNTSSRNQYTATASQTVFTYTFEIFNKDDIAVDQDGTILSEGTHYTVSGVGDNTGGDITLTTGAASGAVITLYRAMALERLTDYQNSGDFLADEVNEDFDRVWLALQQNLSTANTGIRPSINDPVLNSANTELASVSVRGGKVLGFAVNGTIDYLSATIASGAFTDVTTTSVMTTLSGLIVGDVVQTAEFSTGNGGGGVYDVVLTSGVTTNTYNIIAGVADPLISFVLRSSGTTNLRQLGAAGDGVTDDTGVWNFFVANGGDLIPAGNYLVSGVVKVYLMPTYVATTGNNHSAGYLALESMTTGFDNTAFGVQAMKKNTTGNRNTAIGLDALAQNTTGDHNLAVGQNALGFNTAGKVNTALGIDALEFNLTGSFNVAVGQYALLNLDASTGNTAVGYNVMEAGTSGNNNCAFGFNALTTQDGVTGNTAVGTDAGRFNETGTFITALGFKAGRTNTVGTHLTLVGDQAGFKNLDGTHNCAMGFTSLLNNVSGSYNTAVGDNSLFLTTGGNNSALGGFAGYSVTTGTDNTFIGYSAGFTGLQKVDAVNTTAIGRGAYTTDDNTVQLGSASVVGVGVGQNKIHWLSAAPVTGTWARGSVVFNLSITAGGSMGWMCTTAGTPGTWKAMPNVAA